MMVEQQQADTTQCVITPRDNPSSASDYTQSEDEILSAMAKQRQRAETLGSLDHIQSEDEILSAMAQQRRQNDFVSKVDLSLSEDKILSQMAKHKQHTDAIGQLDRAAVTTPQSKPRARICASAPYNEADPVSLLDDLKDKSARYKVDSERAAIFLAQLLEQRLSRERHKLALKYQKLVDGSLDGSLGG